MKYIAKFRWWLFKKLNTMVWAICPEPHKSNLGKMWGEAKSAREVLREKEIDARVKREYEHAVRQRNAPH
jgi:hypothetical protein